MSKDEPIYEENQLQEESKKPYLPLRKFNIDRVNDIPWH